MTEIVCRKCGATGGPWRWSNVYRGWIHDVPCIPAETCAGAA